jgi:RND family efflux transporter MFP subunit
MINYMVKSSRWRPWLGGLAGVLVMALMLAWLMGAFHHRIPPGPPTGPTAAAPTATRHLVTTSRHRSSESAVGTIRAVHETQVSSRLLGRVRTLRIQRAGQPVQQDEVLVELESDDLKALSEQTRAALKVAETRAAKAKADLDRTESLVQQGITATDKLETDRANHLAAMAEVERAQQGITAATTALSFATIRAPRSGIVVDKRVQEGDVVQPGQLICTLYDPTQLQLVATVREELAGRLQLGQQVDVLLESLGKQCRGTVAEIVPTTSTTARAFEVKVTGPCQPGIVTGMFARLLIPLDEVDELTVPGDAVQSTGQLDFVQVLTGATAQRRFVRLGERRGAAVVVLSGLRAGETVLIAER